MSRILGIGIVTPLGDDIAAVLAAVRASQSGPGGGRTAPPEPPGRAGLAGSPFTALAPQPTLLGLPDPRAGVVPGPDLTGWLTRKKDARLLARAARLALPAAGRALRNLPAGVAEETAIYVAVGREPPDDPEAEPSLLAMAVDGVLNRERLGGRGRELYPPLLPLRTLPNMVLAHVSIQHGLRGENGTFAGEGVAGVQAVRAACLAVDEGRAPFALAGAAFSGVDLASARDRLRLGQTAPPGEAAVFVLVGPGDPLSWEALDWDQAMGDCGPVAGLWGLVGL